MIVKNEFFCHNCNCEKTTEHPEYECKCGSKDVSNFPFLVCSCGEKVYTNHFTNECDACGKLYNSSGQELAPVEQWESEDAYACFGPQDY